MSILIDFSADSILHLLPYINGDKKEALCFDIYNKLIMHMQEACLRIDNALRQVPEDMPFSVESTIMDLWDVLDTAHRVFLLMPKLKINLIGQAAQTVEMVNDIRDSFQHLDERLEYYYSQQSTGESVLGDIKWRYRAAPGEVERVFYHLTGVVRDNYEPVHADILTANAPQFQEHTGIYDVEIYYIKRNVISAKMKEYKFSRVSLLIDELIRCINGTLKLLEERWAKIVAEATANNGGQIPTGGGIPPLLVEYY